MITEDKVTEIFCITDDFCKVWGRKINCVMRYFPFKLIGRGSASAKGVHQHSRRA